MGKPSLHEIAAMPFPASVNAMREHYNPDWGKDLPPPGEGKRKFRVKADWTISGQFNDFIEAESEEEAKELLSEYVLDDVYGADVELDHVSISEAEQ